MIWEHGIRVLWQYGVIRMDMSFQACTSNMVYLGVFRPLLSGTCSLGSEQFYSQDLSQDPNININ